MVYQPRIWDLCGIAGGRLGLAGRTTDTQPSPRCKSVIVAEESMSVSRWVGCLILLQVLGLAACSNAVTSTRDTPLGVTVGSVAQAPKPLSPDVQQVRVLVPETLVVSEANLFYPGGDIVWREDPAGDRHAQVRTIFDRAMRQGIAAMPAGTVPVILDVQVTRFHALSEKARYTVGGVHALQFYYVLRNPETGEAYGAPKFVKADFKALGGIAAIEAERQGITQKKRITEHLAQVIQNELSDPDGYHAQALGLIGALNQL